MNPSIFLDVFQFKLEAPNKEWISIIFFGTCSTKQRLTLLKGN
jgi:hypothetical protein